MTSFLRKTLKWLVEMNKKQLKLQLKKKQNEFPKQYYKMYYLPQTATETEVIKKRKQKFT